MSKAKCDCGKIAVWVYMPGFSHNQNPYICEDCITSPNNVGCSCNWRYVKDSDMPEGVENKDWSWVEFEGDEHMSKITKQDGIWQFLDEKGRPYPCIEFEYDQEGFPQTDEEE